VSSHLSLNELGERLAANSQWLAAFEAEAPTVVFSREIEIRHLSGRTLLAIPTNSGFRQWRVDSAISLGNKLQLSVSGRFGRKSKVISFFPRPTAKQLAEDIYSARLETAGKIASSLKASGHCSKINKISISRRKRTALISGLTKNGKNVAVIADLTGKSSGQALVSHYLRLLMRPFYSHYSAFYILTRNKSSLETARELGELLKSPFSQKLHLLELGIVDGNYLISAFDEKKRRRSGFSTRFCTRPLSGFARQVQSIAPDKIDVEFRRNQEVLHFLGLPFARIRTSAASEQQKVFFGYPKQNLPLDESTETAFLELLGRLCELRSALSPNTRHAFYTLRPESWLESILRRNIASLDGNLVISPVYRQFRAAGLSFDMLAIRDDGRLVIIELKSARDPLLPLQCALYWNSLRQIRSQSSFRRYSLFPGREISDAPPVVYTVAPSMEIDRNFDLFASFLKDEIEVWGFELDKKWREEIRVVRRYGPAGQTCSPRREFGAISWLPSDRRPDNALAER
jgi:hypothetical protein